MRRAPGESERSQAAQSSGSWKLALEDMLQGLGKGSMSEEAEPKDLRATGAQMLEQLLTPSKVRPAGGLWQNEPGPALVLLPVTGFSGPVPLSWGVPTEEQGRQPI